MGALNGLSLARTEARVTITAVGWTGEDTMAFSIEGPVRSPSIIVSPLAGLRDACFRTSAVIVWPLLSASSMTTRPVRPLPPIMRICMLRGRVKISSEFSSVYLRDREFVSK